MNIEEKTLWSALIKKIVCKKGLCSSLETGHPLNQFSNFLITQSLIDENDVIVKIGSLEFIEYIDSIDIGEDKQNCFYRNIWQILFYYLPNKSPEFMLELLNIFIDIIAIAPYYTNFNIWKTRINDYNTFEEWFNAYKNDF